MLRRFLFVLLLCLAELGSADFTALYKKPSNIADSDTYFKVITGADQSSYVLGMNLDTAKYTLRKFDSAGTLLWTSGTFPRSGDAEIGFYDMTLDEDGHCYLAARRRPTGGNFYRPVVYKVRNSTGAVLWSRGHTVAEPAANMACTQVMYRDSKITALMQGNLFSGQVTHLIQWDLGGTELDVTTGGNGPVINEAARFAYHDGEYFMVGRTTGAITARGFLRRYSASLEPVATTYFQVNGNYETRLNDVAIAETGEICVAGQAHGNSTYYGLMIAYDEDFNILVEDITQATVQTGSEGRAMYRGFIERVGGQLRMTGFGGNGNVSVGIDRMIGRQVSIPSGQIRWTIDQSGFKAPGDVHRDSKGDFYWASQYVAPNQVGTAIQRLKRDTGAVEAFFLTLEGNGIDIYTGFTLDIRDEGRLVGYREVSQNFYDGVLWHMIQNPEPVNDTVFVQNNVMTPLDVFANDSFVHPGCSITIVSAPSNGTAVVNAEKTRINYTPFSGFLGSDALTYRVARGTLSATATVNINVRGFLLNVSADRNPIAGQNQTLGRLTLSGAAPSGGAVVAISDDSSLITTPASATVPAGSSVGTFVIQVSPVTSQQIRAITATYLGVTRSVNLTMNPLVPTAISFTPNPLVGGGTTSCKVVINGVAGAGGRTIAIVDNSAYCTPPSTVTVPPGAGSITFNVPTTRPPTQQVVTVIARVTAGEVSATLRINP